VLENGRPVFFLRWGEVLREGRQHATEAIQPVPSRGRRPRVLVVDDSPVIRDIEGEILPGAGIEVLTAENGKAALELVARKPCDLVITDIEMPRMTGLELLRHIRRDNELLPASSSPLATAPSIVGRPPCWAPTPISPNPNSMATT
jgi:two-component system sensor histidine kinase and response regulator WspE